MREVNFSIPNVNKAAVNITTTLYDRRALDCTSTLPLINSLNHLAYLTTSSARIRDILTIDGGIERLVCILKEGRNHDLLEMWKWSLAFQCVVNIGVRGSEAVRTRVVEADMVPVIATILDNYLQVFDKIRQRADSETQRHPSRHPRPAPTNVEAGRSANLERRPSRRQPPPNIEIPAPYPADSAMDISSPRMPVTSPPERSTFSQEAPTSRPNEQPRRPVNRRHRTMHPLSTAVPSTDTADGFGLRPVRDAERLPSMLPGLQAGLASQPDSPTTPSDPLNLNLRHDHYAPRRPALRQQQSTSGDSDDANEDAGTTQSADAETIVGFQDRMDIDNAGDRQTIVDDAANDDLTVTEPSEGQDAETFNITHRSTVDGSINDNTQNNGTFGLSPAQANAANSPTLAPSPYSLYFRERATSQPVLTAMPRDEDVLMSLQLLAYVSKYCNLRSYFQRSHLVPKLKIDRELHLLDDNPNAAPPVEADDGDEYLLPDDVNIFPLVEKFTVRHHAKDMQYWACVVMRNLCRKDESRGGIRQCANYKCGKWEEFQRQFAKCRRCRRTKYCSKDCQKTAWYYHRHWCHNTP